MDATSFIAVIIVIMFFVNSPGLRQGANNQPAANPAQTTQVTETVSAPKTVQPTPAPALGAPDHSPAPYQYISDERMEKVIRIYNKTLSQEDVNKIKTAVNRYCQEKDIDPRYVLAVMARESAFNPNAVSSSGAVGLGQIMPFNYKDLGISNPTDIDQNARGVVYYLKLKLDDWKGFDDQVGLSLASYLTGTGNVRRAGNKYEGHTADYVDDILRIRGII